jgi:hypothetical protein
VSLEKRGFGGGGVLSCMYKVYRVRYRKEPCGTFACISQGVGISPSTETLNFLFEIKDPVSLIMLTGNCNFDDLYKNPGCLP